MPGEKNDNEGAGAKPAKSANVRKPDWATGLKKLYDSVVEEPLPDSFKDLLSRLNDADK